ncbi:LytR/AlgR family response regulator transcription factor [Spongiimicrobium salis]|uniref:LytR/AlgR family response regulator transcription factor n=1 Tax=Spongiimicrobium salis TaxID=1667022 RepID=UPI00374D68A0
MIDVKTLLCQPIPKREVKTLEVAKTLGLGIGIIYLIFVFLEPFQFQTSDYSKYAVFLLFSIAYFMALFIAIQWIFPWINKLAGLKHYYFYHFILGYLFLIILIAFVHHLIQNYLNGNPLLSWTLFLDVFQNAILVGLIPTFILSLISYTRALQKELRNAGKNLTGLLNRTPQEGMLNIYPLNKKDIHRFEAASVVYIKSEDNYIQVFHKIDAEAIVPSELIRTPLKEVVSQLSLPFLRIHRSYVVNLNYVQKVSGNAQGMQLYIDQDLSIPVSRTYIANLKTALEA